MVRNRLDPVPVVGLADALDAHVEDGRWVYIGNFGVANFAAAHELMRRHYEGLWVVMSGAGVVFDQLVGVGAVERAVIGHCWNPIGPTPTYAWRRAMEQGVPRRPQIEEMTLGSLNMALMAGAYGWPFAPELALAGTGYAGTLSPERYAHIASPFDPATSVGVVAPMQPAVAIIHAQAADRFGNARIAGPLGEVALAAAASDSVVLVVEELLDDDEVARRPELTTIPGIAVDAIVVEPFAAHPEGVLGRYERDIGHFLHYGEQSRDQHGFERYIDRYVRGVANRSEYLQTLESDGLIDRAHLMAAAGPA